MRSLDIRAYFGSIGRMSDSMSPRRDRRGAVGVELMEDRVSLSGFTVQPMGVINGNGDPISPMSLVRQFNPQPDPPSALTRIIAI